LLPPSPLNDGESDDLTFQPYTKEGFIDGKGTILLSDVEVQNDQKGSVQNDLGLREKSPTPTGQAPSGKTQLVKKPLARLVVGRRLVPSPGNNLHEPRDTKPKILKLEGARLPGATILGKQ
jgi:hypothetical protein